MGSLCQPPTIRNLRMPSSVSLARFLMNLFLSSAGYPWTIVRTGRRSAYMAALEMASTGGDLEPFARFILEEMRVDWHKEK
jgi:hypothetical protein